MAKYRIEITVERDEGRQRSNAKVMWRFGRSPNLHPIIASDSVHSHPADPDSAESMAVSQIFRHAEGQNASITVDDIEVVTEHIVNQYKGGKHRGSNRTSSGPRPVRRTIADRYPAKKPT